MKMTIELRRERWAKFILMILKEAVVFLSRTTA